LLAVATFGLFLAALAFIASRRPGAAAAVLLAVLGHFLLDYLVHDADLTLLPAQGASHLGPPFVLDRAAPARGLAATAPGLAFGLQAIVIAWCAAAFARAYSPRGPRSRRIFAMVTALLALAPLPMFVPGALTTFVPSTQALLISAAAEIMIAAVVLYALARGCFLPDVATDPWAQPARTAVDLVRRRCQTAGALALAIAAVYVGQSATDAQARPALGAVSIPLALAYAAIGLRFVRFNPSTLWAATIMCFVIAPLVRIAVGGVPGAWMLPAALLELALGGLSVSLIRTLLHEDLLL
jgi:hypothetical protein